MRRLPGRDASTILFGLLSAAVLAGCATAVKPTVIPVSQTGDQHARYYQAVTGEEQFERGKPRPVIDGVGWVVGIPNKVMLWDRRVDNHRVSPETENQLREYLAANELYDVKVRVNQYHPVDEWRRLRRNQRVSPGWRYTVGALHTLGYTVLPGRIFGGDRYNPYTNSLYVYSDAPPMSIVEAAYAKDVHTRDLPGTYAAVQDLPVVGLWHETLATRDALDYTYLACPPEDGKEAENLLYPRYGARVGGAVGSATGVVGFPTWIGAGGGHVVGRLQGRKAKGGSPEASSSAVSEPATIELPPAPTEESLPK